MGVPGLLCTLGSELLENRCLLALSREAIQGTLIAMYCCGVYRRLNE